MNIILVNEKDEVVGSAEYVLGKINGIYRVSAVWLTNKNDEVLLAQRKLTKLNDPGKWGPAASGTLEVGETYESNAYKEALEEIGLSDYKFRPGPKLLNNFGKFTFFVQWYTCEVDWPVEKFKIQAEEVEKIEWIQRNSLKRELVSNPDKFVAGAYIIWEPFLK